MPQDEDADCRSESRIARAGIIDFRSKCVQGFACFCGDVAEGVPELGFQRDAGPVAMERERVFGEAGGHVWTVVNVVQPQNP
jgi:hypothetical protein